MESLKPDVVVPNSIEGFDWWFVYNHSEGFAPRTYAIQEDSPESAEEVYLELEGLTESPEDLRVSPLNRIWSLT